LIMARYPAGPARKARMVVVVVVVDGAWGQLRRVLDSLDEGWDTDRRTGSPT
jgi:hypothetical protein